MKIVANVIKSQRRTSSLASSFSPPFLPSERKKKKRTRRRKYLSSIIYIVYRGKEPDTIEKKESVSPGELLPGTRPLDRFDPFNATRCTYTRTVEDIKVATTKQPHTRKKEKTKTEKKTKKKVE